MAELPGENTRGIIRIFRAKELQPCCQDSTSPGSASQREKGRKTKSSKSHELCCTDISGQGKKDNFSGVSISQPTLLLSARLDPKSLRSSFGIFLHQPWQKNHLVRAGAASCRFALLAHR